MAGHLQMMRMRGFNCGPQFGASDMHVSLEIRGAGRGPEVDEGGRVVWAGQCMHLHEEIAWTLEIGGRGLDMGADETARLNETAQVNVGIRLHRTGGSNRRNPVREIHARS